MLHFKKNPPTLLACWLLIMTSGCTQMFSGNLDQLISEKQVQKNFPTRSKKTDLSGLKIDPLLLENGLNWNNAPASKREPTSLTELAGYEPNASESHAIEPVVETIIPEKAAVRLEPVVGEIRAPDVNWDAYNSPESTIRLQARPQLIVSLPKTLAPISSSATNSIDFIPGREIPESITASHPEPPLAKMLPDNQTPEIERSLTPIPVSAAPVSEPGESVNFESTNPEIEKVTGIQKFVSEQIKLMVPPFANHPSIAVCHFECSSNDTTETCCVNYVTRQPETIPIDSRFLEELIGSSLDTNSIHVALAETVRPAGTNAEPENESRTAANSVHLVSPWPDQLDNTIHSFQHEIDKTTNDEQTEALTRGLSILQSLRLSLTGRSATDSMTTPELNDYWNHQMDALDAIIKNSVDANHSRSNLSDALAHLNQAAYELRDQADLKLTASCFCKQVVGFGQYTPFESSSFSQSQKVLIYCEIENFTAVFDSTGNFDNYRTRISSSFRITDSTGVVVQDQDFPVVTDNARKLRNDFFMHLPIQFADLKPGDYELVVDIQDYGSNKTASIDRPLIFSIR